MAEHVLVQPLDGTWQTLGVGALRGAEVFNPTPTWNVGGPDTFACDVEMDSRLSAFEVREFTPLEYKADGGDISWSGRVTDTPRTERGMQIVAEGWQHHPDDDSSAFAYVHDNKADWKDSRSYAKADLTRFKSAPQVHADGGSVSLVFAKGSSIDQFDLVGVTIDQGPDSDAWAVSYDVMGTEIGTTGLLAGSFDFYVRSHDAMTEMFAGGGTPGFDYHDAVTAAGAIPAAGWGGTLDPAGTSGPRRYISLFYQRAGANTVMGTEEGIRLDKIILYNKAAYRIGGGLNRSGLKASQVVKAEYAKCPLLSKDQSQIVDTAFEIKALGALHEKATPNEASNRANSFHRYRKGIDHLRRPFFKPQPAVPELVVNTRDDGVDYKDASHNSGADIYNKVIVIGDDGSGDPLEIVRYSAQLPGATFLIPAGITIPNPSFTVDTSGWTRILGAGTLTRDTSVFNSSPASGRINQTATDTSTWETTLSGTFLAGFTYKARIMARGNSGNQAFARAALFFGAYGTDWVQGSTFGYSTPVDPLNFQAFEVAWTPKNDIVNPTFRIRNTSTSTGGASVGFIDDLVVTQAVSSVPDRRGFVRSTELSVQAPTDPASMTMLGDLFLQFHARPPFKGSLTLDGVVVKELTTGRKLRPVEVARRTGELIRLADIIDPYTGTKGRDALMVTASKQAAVVNLALDEDRGSFEALLSRMSVAQGR